MNTPFNDFTEEEYNKYSELFNGNVELEDGKLIVNGADDSTLTLVKHDNGDIYMEIEEEEQDFLNDGDNIYLVDPIWWAKLNCLDQLIEDVKNGVELYYSEYR